MSNKDNTDLIVSDVLGKYQASFSAKEYSDENNDSDILMNVFGISPEMKRENRQYWGRELGMCWQRIIIEICKLHCADYAPAIKIESDEPCDLVVGKYAIDTKYRIGSGDSGTLKKFKAYSPILKGMGYTPLLLILRTDNLPAAIQACTTGGWQICTGKESLAFIHELTGFNLEEYIISKNAAFRIVR